MRERGLNMKKLNERKLNKVYDLISSYDCHNSSLLFEIPSLMKFCIEADIKDILSVKIGKIDESQLANIFDSMNLNVNISFVRNKANVELIKFRMNYSDVATFKNNYMQ